MIALYSREQGRGYLQFAVNNYEHANVQPSAWHDRTL